MTPDQLRAILKASTAGPWARREAAGRVGVFADGGVEPVAQISPWKIDIDRADAAAIVAMHNAGPLLVELWSAVSDEERHGKELGLIDDEDIGDTCGGNAGVRFNRAEWEGRRAACQQAYEDATARVVAALDALRRLEA